jgi:SAM-dependent methyltransferase
LSTPYQLNLRYWDEVTKLHAQNNVYGLDSFRAGGSTLRQVELEELGDVSGKTLLHLQCHFGLDTLSWARRGAIVTGVDFSPNAIGLARSLASEARIDARFVESDVYALADKLTERFDIVFASYGVLHWLPDLEEWARIVSGFLKPNGIFYIVEGHPFSRVFPIDGDVKDGSKELRPYFPYFHDEAGTRWEDNIDYADGTTRTPPIHTWQHSISDILNAVIRSRLRVEFLHEFPFCAWKIVAFAERMGAASDQKAYFTLPERFPRLPLMFSLRAKKPE